MKLWRKDYDDLRRALWDLLRSHNGYHNGVGPCICAAHENARKVLGISRGDERPKGLSDSASTPP